MGLHVSFEMGSLFAGEFTLSAIKMIFSWVNPHVSFEATSYCAGVVTLCAPERLFSWVNTHVFLEDTSYCAEVVTFHALERLFTRVCQHVLLQWAIRCVGRTTLIAFERFFSGMFLHVLFEISRIVGRILAQFATEELFPVFIGIFICCHCFHLHRTSFMELRQGWKITDEHWAILANWRVCVVESESYQIVG